MKKKRRRKTYEKGKDIDENNMKRKRRKICTKGEEEEMRKRYVETKTTR